MRIIAEIFRSDRNVQPNIQDMAVYLAIATNKAAECLPE